MKLKRRATFVDMLVGAFVLLAFAAAMWSTLDSQSSYRVASGQQLAAALPQPGQSNQAVQVLSSGVWPSRAPLMRAFIPKHFPGKAITVLEIGPWCGRGSTRIWLETVADNSRLILIDAWRPFSTPEDAAIGHTAIRQQDPVMRDAMASTFDVVTEFERSRPSLTITMVRARAAEFMPNLMPDSVDMSYVDGSHYYNDVVQDFRQVKRVLRNDFAVVCGDDLEYLPTPELLKLAKQHPQVDWLTEATAEGAGTGFHPGVMLAIEEEFGREVVHVENGFWWIFKRGGKFVK
jgi:SAM-dependent methyltransferase